MAARVQPKGGGGLTDTMLTGFNTNMEDVGGRLGSGGGDYKQQRRNGGDTSMSLDIESGGDRLYAM